MIYPRHILVTRTDKLGDVLLTLPALKYLRDHLPEVSIDFLVRPEYIELLRPFLDENRITPQGYSERRLTEWRRWQNERGYDTILFLHADAKMEAAAFLARIRWRAGVYSKFFSFLLLNIGKRQRRSSGLQNEGVYTLELAEKLIKRAGKLTADLHPPKINLGGDAVSAREARASLEGLGISEGDVYFVVHPGMGGSALNLSVDQYTDLVQSLLETVKGHAVLTEGPTEEDRALVGAIARRLPQVKIIRGRKLTVIREVFRGARLVVAPSTGPLHLAHYSGARTVGLYSPVRSQRPERWEPWGGAGQSSVIFPPVSCPGNAYCVGRKCGHYFCFNAVNWSQEVLKRVGAEVPAR